MLGDLLQVKCSIEIGIHKHSSLNLQKCSTSATLAIPKVTAISETEERIIPSPWLGLIVFCSGLSCSLQFNSSRLLSFSWLNDSEICERRFAV